MGEKMEKRFTWVLKQFSSLQEICHSRTFAAAGCNWCLVAYPKGYINGGYLSVYLNLVDPASLPSGWRREVKFGLTLVNKGLGKSNISFEWKCCFDAQHKGWGNGKIVPLTKLHDKGEGFLMNNRLVIVAEVQVFPAVVLPEETVKIIDPPRSKQGSDEDGSDEGTDEDSSFEEDGDNVDASSAVSDDGGEDTSSFSQSIALEDASHRVGDHGIKTKSVTAESEDSNDDAPKEDVEDELSSHVSNASARNETSLDQVNSLEDSSQTVENGGRGFNTVSSITETANTLLTEKVQPAKDTVDINGFDVFSSQEKSVSHIFRRHPDIALNVRRKNRQIRSAYMNELLSLIELLCQSPEKLSEDDLSNADDTLADLIDVGFNLDWLKTKLNEVNAKKKKEQNSEARLRTIEEQLQKMKLMFLDLETQLQMKKAEALAARAPLSFDDVVC